MAAHHSFAMYELKPTYVLPVSSREPIVWAIEMDGASVAARDGTTVNGFPCGKCVLPEPTGTIPRSHR